MKLLIIGYSRHGKDTLAALISQKTEMKFVSSSEFACKSLVFPKLTRKYAFKTSAECFEFRRFYRKEWFNIISEFNKDDRARLAKEILKTNDIYVGMRCLEEFKASRNLFDKVIWIDAKERVPIDPNDPFDIDESMADVTCSNNGTIEDMRAWVERNF